MGQKDQAAETIDSFAGNIYLTHNEKQYRLRELQVEIKLGNVDMSCLSFIERINAMREFVSTQCCCGHNQPFKGRRAYMDFRTSLPFPVMLDKLQPFFQRYHHCDLSIYGYAQCMPRYCVWFQNQKWKKQCNYLIQCLKRKVVE